MIRHKKTLSNVIVISLDRKWRMHYKTQSLFHIVCVQLWPEADSHQGEQIERALEQMKCLRELLGTQEPTNLPPKRRAALEGMVESLYEWLDRLIRKMHVKSSDCRGYLLPQLR